jgi:hypothetical protein
MEGYTPQMDSSDRQGTLPKLCNEGLVEMGYTELSLNGSPAKIA